MMKLGSTILLSSFALGGAGCASPLSADDEPAQVAAIVVAGPGDACASETTAGLVCLTGLVCMEGKCVDDPDRCAPGEHVAWKPRGDGHGLTLRGAPPEVLCVSNATPSLSCAACDADEKAVSACLPVLPNAGHGPVRCVPKRADDAGTVDCPSR